MRRWREDWGSPILQGILLGFPSYVLAYLAYRHFTLVPREVLTTSYWNGTAVLTPTQSTSIIVGHLYLLAALLLGFRHAKSK